MKLAGVLALIGFALVLGVLFVWHDLRGWEGMYPENPTRIVATLPGRPDFTIADCVPGTVEPHDLPAAAEYSGSASVTVLSCRSRSSAAAIVLAYWAIAGSLLFLVWVAINRGRSGD